MNACILQGDPECTYTEDNVPAEDNLPWPDHRRQMGQFCGQHTFCDRCKPGGGDEVSWITCVLCRFNNQMVLETAKVNVAKHYAVVGVLEMWDSTLELLEHKLPYFFEGGKHKTC